MVFSVTIGRHANRIAGGEFELNGTKYNVGLNEGKNSLHGGINGFDKKVWSAEEVDGQKLSLKLSIVSEDGEEGFPGTLKVTVTYTLTKGNALKINYSAVTDKDTVVNLQIILISILRDTQAVQSIIRYFKSIRNFIHRTTVNVCRQAKYFLLWVRCLISEHQSR